MFDIQGARLEGYTDEEIAKYLTSKRLSPGDYGFRADGIAKGPGFFGELKRPDGKISTELSIGVTGISEERDKGGGWRRIEKQIEIPTLVPTLSQDEIDYLLKGGKPTKEIVDKAIQHARERIAQGKSPFKEWQEIPMAGKYNFDIQGALKEGYSYSEIVDYLGERQKKIAEIAGEPKLAVSHAPTTRPTPGALEQFALGTAGAGEAGVKLAEMAIKFIPSGILEGIMAVAPPGTKVGDIAQILQQGIQKGLTYEPKTEMGKLYTAGVEWPFRQFEQWGDAAADAIRESIAPTFGNEIAVQTATTIGAAIKFLPYSLGLRAAAPRGARIPRRIGLPEGAKIERPLEIPPELERPALPPGQGFILKEPKPEIRKGAAPREPEIFVKKPDGTYTPGFYDNSLGRYVTPIEQAAPEVRGLPKGQGFIMEPPKPETILRPKAPTGKGPVTFTPEGEPIYPSGMEPVIEPLPRGIEPKRVGVAPETEPILAEVPKAKPEAPKPKPTEYTHIVTIMGEDHPAIISRNTTPGEKPWRITYFEKDGDLVGHLDMANPTDYPTEFISGLGKRTKVFIKPRTQIAAKELTEVPKPKTPQDIAYDKYLNLEQKYSEMLGEEKPNIKEIRKINHQMREVAKETGRPELIPPKEVETPSAAKELGEKGRETIPSRPLVNPKASAVKQDTQLRAQQAWDKKYGKTPASFRQFVESKGHKWPMKSTHPEYETLKREFDALKGEKPSELTGADKAYFDLGKKDAQVGNRYTPPVVGEEAYRKGYESIKPKETLAPKGEVAYGAGTVKDLIREYQALEKEKKIDSISRRNEIYGILKDYYKKEGKEATFEGKESLTETDWDMVGATIANDALAWSHDAAMKSLPSNIKRQIGHIEAEKEVPVPKKGKAAAPVAAKEEPHKRLEIGKPTAEAEPGYSIVARRELDLADIKTLEDVRKAFESGRLDYKPSRGMVTKKWQQIKEDYSETDMGQYNKIWEDMAKDYKISKGKETVTVRYGRKWNEERSEWETDSQVFEKARPEEARAVSGEGIEFLGRTTMPGEVGEAGIKKFREIAKADKQFGENPTMRLEWSEADKWRLVFTAKDAETGMPRRYQFKPEMVSGAIKDLIESKTLKEGDYIRLSPGYLEGKSTEIYLAKRGVESIVDKYYEEGLKREKVFKEKGAITFPQISINWPDFGRAIEKAKEIPKAIKEKFNKLRFYPDVPMEFRNAIRNEVVGAIDKARDKVYNRHAHAIWGGLKKADVEKSVEVIFAKDQLSRAKLGKGNPNISIADAQKIFNDVQKTAPKEALDAADRYRDITEAYQKDLVSRGILEPGDLIEDYAPHFVVDYTPDWTFNVGIPTRLKRPFRGYKKRAFGTSKEYQKDADAILGHFLKVEHDNLIEDFIQKQAAKYDITPTLSVSERIRLFGAEANGKPRMPKPGKIIEIGGERYRVYTPDIPFNRQLFPTEEGLMALGRYKRTYVLPENIHNAFTHFSDRGSAFTYWTNRATAYWKSAAILSHFPSFNVNNMIGDTWMALTQHPKPGRLFLEYPTAMKYLTGKGKGGYFTELDAFIKNHNILQGIFTEAELTRIRKAHNPLGMILAEANKVSKFRESINRTAYASSLLKEMQAGRGKEMAKAHSWISTEGLPVEDALGKISRDVLVDYQWVSRGFHRFIRGMTVPFGTWYLKASPLLWRWTQKNWGKALIGFMGLPLAATAFNNRDEKTKELESKLPDYVRHRVHFVMGENPDKTIRAWSFQLPQDVLIGTKIFSVATDYANRAANGEMPVKEAAIRTIKDTITQEKKGLFFLTAPMVRFIGGLIKQRDPYDDSPIYSMKPDYMTWQRRLRDQALFFIKSSVPFLSWSIANYERGMPTDVGVKRILDNVAGKGALGIRDITPTGQVKINGKLYDWDDVEKMNWIRNKEMGYLGDFENDFVESAKNPKEFLNSPEAQKSLLKIYNLWSDFIPDLKKEKDEKVKVGVVLDGLGTRLTNRIVDNSVLQKWQRVRIERAKTDEERRKLGAEFQALRQRGFIEAFKARPKTTREMELLNRMKDHELPWDVELLR